jgi:hypothetical protein
MLPPVQIEHYLVVLLLLTHALLLLCTALLLAKEKLLTRIGTGPPLKLIVLVITRKKIACKTVGRTFEGLVLNVERTLLQNFEGRET